MPDLLMSVVICAKICTEKNCLLTLGSSVLTSGKRYFRVNFAWGRLGAMKSSPCRTMGVQREMQGTGFCSTKSVRRWGGRAEPQPHTGGDRVLAGTLRELQSLRLYLQGGQHLTKQSAGRLVEGTLQTFLMLAQISPHREQIWHELCELWFPNAPCHKFHQTVKHCRSDSGL